VRSTATPFALLFATYTRRASAALHITRQTVCSTAGGNSASTARTDLKEKAQLESVSGRWGGGAWQVGHCLHLFEINGNAVYAVVGHVHAPRISSTALN
jgi:hypothetical protein